MADETQVTSAMHMDRSASLGNSEQADGRRALHVKSFQVGLPVKKDWDTFSVAYPDTVTEIWTLVSGVTTVAIITLVFVDSSKNDLSSGSIVNL